MRYEREDVNADSARLGAGQGAASFKEAILSEAFNPASQSSPARSLERLGAGIPLAPEALIELEHQGYVQKVPYKVTTVTKLA